MNMINSFNQTMNYIETVLDGEMDENRISQLSGYSYALFSRIFSILTETTLSEYIRLRRLTQSAMALRESKEKVIDIAMKYGYDSPDSFCFAFKNFHGHTPSEVRKGKHYKVFSCIQLSLSIKGGRTMDIRIQTKPAFLVAGLKMDAIESSQCPAVWTQLFERCSCDVLEKLGSGQSYGVCYAYDMNDGGHINYMAGYDAADSEFAEKLNLDVMAIAETEYAIAKLKGPIPRCIHEGWKYLMEVFFPESGYQHSGAPDFEVYSIGDMFCEDYEMELWVPVIKASGD